ncbi:hypothetical protein B0T25DRAFT_573237 [Lasiosphaeria hispida]|uniref:Uncharacterized protein n=1 Tax=Lasiosphaeria hispida TaxID=260671 RepID=A0AAJ0H9I7_9PEZI|nr:hypothetical protein B0T25DRAFT_573237 [Lasiosphaeria hispida]
MAPNKPSPKSTPLSPSPDYTSGHLQMVPIALDPEPHLPYQDAPPPSYEASTDNPPQSQAAIPTPPTTATPALSRATLPSSQYKSPAPMTASHRMSQAERERLEDSDGCCFSTRGGCCFSDMGGCCFSSNGGCCFSDHGGCCFSDHGGACCSDSGPGRRG